MSKKRKLFDKWKPNKADKNGNLANGTIQQRKKLKWFNRLIGQALSRFEWVDLPPEINARYLEHGLLKHGFLSFTQDDFSGEFLALPFNHHIGNLTVYGEPANISVYSEFNGYKRFNVKDFAIIYDNLAYEPIIPVLWDYAETLANIEMAMTVNMENQKTPFIITGDEEEINSYKIALNSVESNTQAIFATKNFNVNAFQVLNTNVPYLLDKFQEHKNNVYNEALQFLGIDTISYQKKERKTNEEINAEKETTLSARNSAIQAREQACEKINQLFGLSVKCNWVSDLEENANNPYKVGEDDE